MLKKKNPASFKFNYYSFCSQRLYLSSLSVNSENWIIKGKFGQLLPGMKNVQKSLGSEVIDGSTPVI
jgi:hypothetical protein